MQCPACSCQRSELLLCGGTDCAVSCLQLSEEQAPSLWLDRLCSALPAAVREASSFSVAGQTVQCPAFCCERSELLLCGWTGCAVPCLLLSEKRAPSLWRDRLCSALPAAVREASSFSVAGQAVQCPAFCCERSELLLCGWTDCSALPAVVREASSFSVAGQTVQCPAFCCERSELLLCGWTGCAVPCLQLSEKRAPSLWWDRLCSALPAAVREASSFSVAGQTVQCPAFCCERSELLLCGWTGCAVPCLLL